MQYEALYFGHDDENPFTDAEIMVTISQEEFQALLKALAENDHELSRTLHNELEEVFSHARIKLFQLLTNFNPCDAE